MTRETQKEAVATFNSSAINENDMKSLWKLSKQIRKEILSKNWKFAGTFDKYKPLKMICTVLKWVLLGRHNSDRDRTTQVETVVEMAAQIVSQNVKSDRQIQYHQRYPDSLFYSRLKLSTYLSRRLAGCLNKEFVIAFERTCVTNIPDLDI